MQYVKILFQMAEDLDLIDRQWFELSDYEVNKKNQLVYVDDSDGERIEIPINTIVNREDGTLPILTYQI